MPPFSTDDGATFNSIHLGVNIAVGSRGMLQQSAEDEKELRAQVHIVIKIEAALLRVTCFISDRLPKFKSVFLRLRPWSATILVNGKSGEY